jgi:hypothetical protein
MGMRPRLASFVMLVALLSAFVIAPLGASARTSLTVPSISGPCTWISSAWSWT